MKNFLYSLCIAFAALAATACDDDNDKAPDFALSTAEWSFAPTEGSQKMIVSAPGAWAISGIPDWITVKPAEAVGPREILISYTANDTKTPRTAKLTVTCNGETLPIDIEQQEAPENP